MGFCCFSACLPGSVVVQGGAGGMHTGCASSSAGLFKTPDEQSPALDYCSRRLESPHYPWNVL